MKRLIVIITAIMMGTTTMAATIESHRVSVRDVDTIVVGGTPMRLNGVDGPELSTRAGRNAKAWMQSHVRGKTITCQLNGERTYDRMVGVCFIDGVDIGASAVAAGHALDCRRYSGGRYRNLETAAARSRINRAGYCR
ncbi:thermonuclease family protein [Tateyamaria sp.]|uniref:thermonuclease family protein n=1 Tax=Tateyamaria sp. TaxID=1929288 RepID=UPI00329E4E6C